MTARHIHIITIVLVVALISCVGVLLVSFGTLHRMFAPRPRIVEDANFISEDTTGHFVAWLGDWPAQVVHVYEYDSRGFYPNVFLRFTVPDLAEYDAWKRSIPGISDAELVASLPRESEYDVARIKSWWALPKAGIRKFVVCYVAFDDPNQTAYVSYLCPD